jgi:hypothetical protein
MHNLQSGVGITNTDTAHSLQLHDPLAEDTKESGGVWFVKDGSPSLLEDFDRLEYTFMAETAESEALEPRTLTEAKCRPNWLLLLWFNFDH